MSLLSDVLARLEALSLRGEQVEANATVLGADDRPNAQPDWLGREAKPTARVDEAGRLIVGRRAVAVGQLEREKVPVLAHVFKAVRQ